MRKTPHTARAALYLRISDDKAGGGLGVKRQREDCEALAAARGWEVVEVYTDNDRSAYSGKPRPAYERMMRDIDADAFDAVISWHADRLHRSPRELESFVDAIQRNGVQVQTVKSGEMDLSTPTGLLVARILGATSRHESEHKSDRIRRKALQMAQAGQPTGGGRPYGFLADKVTHDPVEAEVIREVAGRVLAGESPYAIARDLNDRGIPTASGNRWHPNTLKRLICSPRIAGLRQHITRPTGTNQPGGGVYRGEGDLYPAIWKPIIPRRQWERVRVKADKADRRTRSGRTYLLTGFLFCWACGRHLVGQPNAGHPSYQCAKAAGGCGRVCIKAEPLEDHIEDRVRTALERGDLTRMAPPDGDALAAATAALHAVEEDIAGLDEDHGAGLLSRAEWRPLRATLATRRDALRRDQQREEEAAERTDWDAQRWSVDWDRDEVATRRAAMLRTVLERVEVGPGRPGPGSRPGDRLELLWKA